MWTLINQIFTTHHAQNAWALLAVDGAWHKILPNAADGVTNVHLLLITARANGKQAYVVLDAAKNITQVYL
ncbi:hypothetical protein ASF72_17200 [Arthrobacter sp. Leaf141]|uniref:hypothetical protein n=1 Tax=Micrococcaceae TaxID=1268 RepID=UPI0006F1C414|nr:MULTISPECIES: hypothetical protein [Micrococcaceae]KQR00042.1 hypothetical protein ASF72_17200 [Arthrobacter sp. Leaf141]